MGGSVAGRGVTRQRIIEYIGVYIAGHGYGPTIREIAENVGCALSNAHRHLGRLERDGVITRKRNIARSIAFVRENTDTQDKTDREVG